VWVTWQQGAQIVLATSRDGGRTFGRARAVGRTDAPQWSPSIAATGRRGAFLAWIDERQRQVEGELPRASVFGARIDGERIGPARELDTAGPASDLARQLDNDWAPVVAARGRDVVVAWTDFRTYDWRIVARRSRDGGRRFGPPATLTDAPADVEALDDAPDAVVDRRGPLVAWTAYRAGTTIAPHPLYDIRMARPGAASRLVDPHGGAQIPSFAPALALGPGDRPLVVWQDHADGVGSIRAGRRGIPVARSAANQWRPALHVAGRSAIVAWEDERDGVARIYVTRTARPQALG
jgi:hypothetical protein